MYTLIFLMWGQAVVIPGFSTAALARAAIITLGLGQTDRASYFVVQVS